MASLNNIKSPAERGKLNENFTNINNELVAHKNTDTSVHPASKISNDSSVTGTFVKDALNTLSGWIGTLSSLTTTVKTNIVAAINEIVSNLSSHMSNTSNPHSVTKSQVGLGNCDNTSDLNKPISTATQTALDTKEPTITKNTAFNQNFETSTANIKMNNTVSVGTSSNIARADHVHPVDTSRAPLASPTFTGAVTTPQLTLSVANGTTPMTVTSTTKVANLNVDAIDGCHINDAGTTTSDLWTASKINTQLGTKQASDATLTALAALDSTVGFIYETGADTFSKVAYGTTAGTVCQGNDSRLSDSRTPTAHKSTHATGGSDALSPSDIGLGFKGALVRKTTNQSIPDNVATKIQFETVRYDTNSFYSAGSPTKLTVPNGTKKIILKAQIIPSATFTGTVTIRFLQSAGLVQDGRIFISQFGFLSSAPISVVDGTYFEVEITQISGGSITINNDASNFFSIEVVE